MGQEIVYCNKCQTRLIGSDFDKGKAFRLQNEGAAAEVLRDVTGLPFAVTEVKVYAPTGPTDAPSTRTSATW